MESDSDAFEQSQPSTGTIEETTQSKLSSSTESTKTLEAKSDLTSNLSSTTSTKAIMESNSVPENLPSLSTEAFRIIRFDLEEKYNLYVESRLREHMEVAIFTNNVDLWDRKPYHAVFSESLIPITVPWTTPVIEMVTDFLRTLVEKERRKDELREDYLKTSWIFHNTGTIGAPQIHLILRSNKIDGKIERFLNDPSSPLPSTLPPILPCSSSSSSSVSSDSIIDHCSDQNSSTVLQRLHAYLEEQRLNHELLLE